MQRLIGCCQTLIGLLRAFVVSYLGFGVAYFKMISGLELINKDYLEALSKQK